MAIQTESLTAIPAEPPATMRAAAIDHFGGPEVLTLHELTIPELGPGEVAIKMHTVGVGPWDLDIREGWTPDDVKPEFPLVLGVDGSGVIVKAAPDVNRLAAGNEVFAYSFFNPKGGFYAEYVVVAHQRVAPIPEGIGLRRAGAMVTTGLTALQGVDDHLHVRPGDAVIVLGASGGVGSLAVQFARLRAARVLATASGEDGVALALRLGADEAVDGKTGDIGGAARRFAPDGIDAVLATVGGDALERCIDTLKPNGRVAYPNGVEPEPRPREGIEFLPYDAVPGVSEFQRLRAATEAARLQIPIAEDFPLAEAGQAHERLSRGHVLGKIVLRIT